jgi:hypothetical protein
MTMSAAIAMAVEIPAKISKSCLVSGVLIWFRLLLNAFLHCAESALEQIVIGSGAAELLKRLGEYFETLLGSYRVHV